VTAGSPPPSWPPAGPSPAGPPPPGPGVQVGGAEYPARPPEQWPAWSPSSGPGVPGSPPAGFPPGDAPAGGRGRSPAGAVVAVAVVLVLVLVAVLGLGTLGDGGGDDLVGSGTSAPQGAPPLGPGDPGSGLGPAEPSVPGLDPGFGDPEALARPLEEVVPEIISFVEEERGHRFATEPVVEGLPDDEFRDRLQATAEGEELFSPDGEAWIRALGVLPPDADPGEVGADLLEGSVQGFYDTDTAELVVRGDVITPYVQTVIAHELTHALDDQVFDLSRIEALGDRHDAAFAFQALIEGTARVVQLAFEDEALSPEEQAASQAEKLGLAGGSGGGGGGGLAPGGVDLLALSIMSVLPYGNGARLVEAVLAGGPAALDRAFVDPPTTSEQVLDPAAYEAREPAVAVPAPVADGPELGRGQFGAVDVRILEVVADPVGVISRMDPRLFLEGSAAVDPMDGFGGGEYVTWRSGPESCIRANLVADDAGGRALLDDLVQGWAEDVGGVEVASTGALSLTFTSCR